jgi:hypothetical protein
MRRTKGFDDDVSFIRQFKQDCAAVGFLDVKRDAALVGIEVKEIKALFRMWRIIFERRDTA